MKEKKIGRGYGAKVFELTKDDGKKTGVVEKEFDPRLIADLLYKATMQTSKFAYSRKSAVLAAVELRKITDIVLNAMLGYDAIAKPRYAKENPITGNYIISLEHIDGEKLSKEEARKFSKKVTEILNVFGLPVWQVSHWNPTLIDNLLRTRKGIVIVDFESGAFSRDPRDWFSNPTELQPFDEVNIERLKEAIDNYKEKFDNNQIQQLTRLLDVHEKYAKEWKDSELALQKKVLRAIAKRKEVVSTVRSIREIYRLGIDKEYAKKQGLELVKGGVKRWLSEGQISEVQGKTLIKYAKTHVERFRDIGIHLLITAPGADVPAAVFGPIGPLILTAFGMTARPYYVYKQRLKAKSKEDLEFHGLDTMVLSGIPKLGCFAYPVKMLGMPETVKLEERGKMYDFPVNVVLAELVVDQLALENLHRGLGKKWGSKAHNMLRPISKISVGAIKKIHQTNEKFVTNARKIWPEYNPAIAKELKKPSANFR